MAMTMPMSTKATIATCIQIHVGDIAAQSLLRPQSWSPGARR
jgi:hypothetical protein